MKYETEKENETSTNIYQLECIRNFVSNVLHYKWDKGSLIIHFW